MDPNIVMFYFMIIAFGISFICVILFLGLHELRNLAPELFELIISRITSIIARNGQKLINLQLDVEKLIHYYDGKFNNVENVNNTKRNRYIGTQAGLGMVMNLINGCTTYDEIVDVEERSIL